MKFFKRLQKNGVSPKTFLSFLGFLILSMGVLAGIALLDTSSENRSRANIYTSYICSTPDGSISVELTATHSETVGTNSVTATGGISKPAGFYYDVIANLYRYACTCPDVNQGVCPSCTSSSIPVTNSGGTSITTIWNESNAQFPGTTGCATLQSDVTLGGVLLRDPVNGNTFSVSCVPAPGPGIGISEVSGYFCAAPSPSSTPTTTPTATQTPTLPPGDPTATPTATPTPTAVVVSLSCEQCDLDQDNRVEHTAPTRDDLDFIIGCLGQSSTSSPCNRANLLPGGPLINSGDVTVFVSQCTGVYSNNQVCTAVPPTTPTPTPTPTLTAAVSWWQSYSGLIYAQSMIKSILPPNFNLVANMTSNINNSAGIPLNNTSGIYLGAGGPSAHSSLRQVTGQQSTVCSEYTIPKLLVMANAQIITPSTRGLITSPGEFMSGVGFTDFGTYRVFRHSGDLEIDLNSTWNVVGTPFVIFNEGGTITVTNSANNENIIAVANDSFLGLFNSGSIVIEDAVGFSPPQSGTDLSPALTGLFFANDPTGARGSGQIQVLSTNDTATEKQFVGSGSFIGCGGVELDREFAASVNDDYASEVFLFNPTLVRNFPTALKDAHVTWSEGI